MSMTTIKEDMKVQLNQPKEKKKQLTISVTLTQTPRANFGDDIAMLEKESI